MNVHPLTSKMLLGGIIFVVMLNVNSVYGLDIFEGFPTRLNCFKSHQVGCNKNLIDQNPDLARSDDGLTEADTWFFLFTQKSPDEPELLHKCADSKGYLPPDTTFDRNCRTEIFIPGFICGVCNMAIYRELKNERLKSGCYNVILVDWTWGNGPDLVETKANIPIVAKQLAIIIKSLKEAQDLTADKFIITGHSFGAHMAGQASLIERVGIINGLDPAGVLYTQDTPLEERLDPSDADCVQVLHTNAGQCLPAYFGGNYTCGDTDVWFNGGLYQYSCLPYIIISILKGDIIYALYTLYFPACSHLHVLQYYKTSINPKDCQFIATPNKHTNLAADPDACGNDGMNCATVGAYGCDCRTNKDYENLYLNTTWFCPYCSKRITKNSHVTCGIKPPA